MLLFGSKTRMVAPENALPGRATPIEVPDRHFVLGTPLKPPFPEDLQTAVVGMGCFWGAERVFWQAQGVYTHRRRLRGRLHAQPDLRGDLLRQDRAHRGRARRVRPRADHLRGDPQAASGRTTTRPGHAPGQRRGHPVPVGDLHHRRPSSPRPSRPPRPRSASGCRRGGYGEITTEIAELGEFYYAEDYHQQYLAKVPNGYCGLGGTGVTCPIGLNRVGSASVADLTHAHGIGTTLSEMAESICRVGEIEICYETFGDPARPGDPADHGPRHADAGVARGLLRASWRSAASS